MTFLLFFSLALANPNFEKAKQHYKEGVRFFDRKLYGAAAREFEKAYQESKDPLLLYNISKSKELDGNLQGAISALESYIPHAPENERAALSKKLKQLKSDLHQTEPQPLPASSTPSPNKPKKPPKKSSNSSWVKPTLWGAGATFMVSGTIFGLQANKARSELQLQCSNGFCRSSAQQWLEKDNTYSFITDVSWVLAASSLGIGTWLHFKDTAVQVTPNQLYFRGTF